MIAQGRCSTSELRARLGDYARRHQGELIA